MEVLAVIFIFFFVWALFKILGLIFYTGAFLITLPLKIIGTVLLLIVMIPLGIFSLVIGLLGILLPLLPFVLLFLGIVYFSRNR
jgi:hypothetical protein